MQNSIEMKNSLSPLYTKKCIETKYIVSRSSEAIRQSKRLFALYRE